jgi:hypothetical protein
VLSAWRLVPAAVEPRRDQPPPLVREMQNLARAQGGRVIGIRGALPANLAAGWGLADLRAHDPVRPLGLAELHQALGASGFDLPGPLLRPWAGLAGAWGVCCLATPPTGVTGAAAGSWREVARTDGGRLYVDTRQEPVLRVARRAVAPPGDPAAGGWEGVDFATTAVVSRPPELGGTGVLQVEESHPWRWRARIRARGRVLAVLHVPYTIGWRAFLDGRPAQVVEADLAAMGVVVADGDHEVRWEYSPPGWPVSGWLTLVGLAGCVILARRRPRTSP